MPRTTREMVDCCEADFAAQCEKEWYLVHEKDVHGEVHFLVEFHHLLGYFHKVPRHWSWLAPYGLAFQRSNVLSPDLGGNLNVLDCDWTVPDQVAADNPLVILRGWVA